MDEVRQDFGDLLCRCPMCAPAASSGTVKATSQMGTGGEQLQHLFDDFWSD